jgi:hypothetical protein
LANPIVKGASDCARPLVSGIPPIVAYGRIG